MRCTHGLRHTYTHTCHASASAPYHIIIREFLRFVCFDWISDFHIILPNKCLYSRAHVQSDALTTAFPFNSGQRNAIFHHVCTHESSYTKNIGHNRHHCSCRRSGHGIFGCRFVCCQSLQSIFYARSHQCTLVRFPRILN